MEENVGLFAVNGNVGGGSFGDRVWWRRYVLGLFVVCERLGRVCLDGLPAVSMVMLQGKYRIGGPPTVGLFRLALGTIK